MVEMVIQRATVMESKMKMNKMKEKFKEEDEDRERPQGAGNELYPFEFVQANHQIDYRESQIDHRWIA
ncbi:hypothetical protein RIF29_30438 [Crotalaria pallida]|uniref:Uncharacterized protein n=1 Tax=Crotalaria pallida TaxID=3830 RepID=A0AAN9HWP2_CROPI